MFRLLPTHLHLSGYYGHNLRCVFYASFHKLFQSTIPAQNRLHITYQLHTLMQISLLLLTEIYLLCIVTRMKNMKKGRDTSLPTH